METGFWFWLSRRRKAVTGAEALPERGVVVLACGPTGGECGSTASCGARAAREGADPGRRDRGRTGSTPSCFWLCGGQLDSLPVALDVEQAALSGIRRSLPRGARSIRAGLGTPTSGTWRSDCGTRKRALMMSVPVRRDDQVLEVLAGYPRPALDRPRPDEGRRTALRPARLARRVHGARDVDDLEVALLRIPYGGAKGGIRCNPRAMSAGELGG